MVSAALVNTTVVPVNRTATTTAIMAIMAIMEIMAVMATIACSRAAAIMPGICAGGAEANSEQSCDTDASCQGRCTQHLFDSHSITPFASTRQ